MPDLKDTIAHILEHRHRLEDANQSTAQQYVILPILRALGWNDTDLASMEILPWYDTGIGNHEELDEVWEEVHRCVDYALIVDEKPKILIECQTWAPQLENVDKQIGSYAIHTGVPIVVLTNGKLWRFYFSWRPNTRLSDRVFCETDIENGNEAVSALEQYLSKANVASGDAELDAEIALEEEAAPAGPEPFLSDAADAASLDNSALIHEGKWTAARVKDLLPLEISNYHETKYPEERRDVCYRTVAEIQNLIEAEGWKMDPPKLNKTLVSFRVAKEAARTMGRRSFGIVLGARIPHTWGTVDRNGEKLRGSVATIPPRIFVQISPEEALQLERQYGCEFWGDSGWCVYYDIPDNAADLLPPLELAYRQHSDE